jgi:D-amino-acid dehydrogenase
MEQTDEVLVIGGGVVGLACAYYLRREGFQVRVLERERPGAGSSHGNCGTITPSHAPPLAEPGLIPKALRWMLAGDSPLYIRPRVDLELWQWLWRFARRCNERDWRATAKVKAELLSTSRQLLAELIREQHLDCEFAEEGLLYVFRDPANAGEPERRARLFAEFGIEAQPWGPARLAREEPALHSHMAGGLFFPGDARLRPDRLVQELARTVQAMGVRIQDHVEVGAIASEADGVRLETSRGEFRAARAVLATGAWSPLLARQLGLRLPIQPGKGYSITYTRPALAPRRALVLRERSVCVTAWDTGFRLGSTMEFSGYDTRLNRSRLDALVRGAREYLRVPEGPERLEEWYGWRPMTWDDLPVIGRAPRIDNLWLATGHGMLGITLCAGTGRMIAEMIAGTEPFVDPRPYAPQRFA